MADSFPSIACSLPLAESRNQIFEWQEIAERALTTEQIEGGYAVTFELDAADVVEDLATRESKCCGFLSIETSRNDETLRLEVTSIDPAAQPVIELLVARP